jgi:O-antigen/teichoic acid export membrane protein
VKLKREHMSADLKQPRPVDSLDSSHQQGLTRPLITSSLGNLAVPLAAFASTPLLAIGLGVEGRGQVAAAVAPLLLAVSLASLGLPEAITHFVARRTPQARRAIKTAAAGIALAGIASTAATAAASRLLSHGTPDTRSIMVLASAAITPTVIIALLRGIAAGLSAWRLINAERYISAGVRLLGLLATFATGTLDIVTATLVLSAAPILGGLSYLRLRNVVNDRPIEVDGALAAPPKDGAPRLAPYALKIWIGSLSGLLLSRIDQVLMIPLAGTLQLGYYAVAANVAELALVVNNAVRDVNFAADSQHADAKRLCLSARISGALSFMVALILSVTIALWLPLLFGDDFRPAMWPAVVLLFAAALGVPGSVAGAGLSARGRPGLRSIALVVATVVNITVLILLVPSLGALGAALATLVGNLIAANGNILMMKRLYATPVRDFYAVRRADIRVVSAKAASAIRGGGYKSKE